MKYKIERIHPHQAGKMGAALLAVLSLLFFPLFILILHNAKALGGQMAVPDMSRGDFLIAPVIYGLLGYLLGSLVSVLYNLFARYVGPIQLDIVEDET